MATILVTGGTGYIGSHTCVELLNAGYDVVIMDNLYNSSEEVLKRIEKITGKKAKFYKVDLLDKDGIRTIFKENTIDAVIHFAGYKAVGESVQIPLTYYQNNVAGSLNLYEVMNEYNVKRIVFSSSACVYGAPKSVPIKEDFEIHTTNPYGATKVMNEMILQDVYTSDNDWGVLLLRYFNPIGAHKSGLLGEVPNGIPNNLVPYIARVANGQLEYLRVWGDDYPTPDGTGVRDYIHVVDLAKGHVLALKKAKGLNIYNLGTGSGYSVLELVKTFERVNNIKVNYKIVGRREGDIASCYADNTKAKEELGFNPTKTLEDMCKDSYTYILNNKK